MNLFIYLADDMRLNSGQSASRTKVKKMKFSLSKDFRRLALALLVPIAGLGTLAALNQAATAQVPENLKLVARQRLSQLHGLSLSALTVGNSAKAQYLLQGKTAFKFKVRNNESGAVYQISLDSSGQEVNAEQLLQQERIAYQAKFGKLDPRLAVKLASAPPEQLRWVYGSRHPLTLDHNVPIPIPLSHWHNRMPSVRR